MDEQSIIQLFEHDFSAGTEAFAEDLLARLKADAAWPAAEQALRAVAPAQPQQAEVFQILDDDLDMLAAAGDRFAMMDDNDDDDPDDPPHSSRIIIIS